MQLCRYVRVENQLWQETEEAGRGVGVEVGGVDRGGAEFSKNCHHSTVDPGHNVGSLRIPNIFTVLIEQISTVFQLLE